ncbi:MAG: hypothetical protein HZC17_02025 [Candidatus Omnitrophica bacterium]|nr:hypothetical protein [Candidatus Omnitrophota bacterium]
MIPLQFRALFTLFDRSCAGEFRSEDEIKPLISILSELNVPVIRERSDKWAKDSRLWLPHVEGRPRYYLLTDMQDQAYLKVSEAFQKDIFDPEFKDKVVVDISEGGAVVSGVAATPFMIFSNRVESEKIEDLASKIKTIPEYKKSHFYTLPSGYVTFKYHGKTYLFDNGHLDTVIGFIPARATSSGKNILLIDPWYHKEVAENAEFKRLIAEQKIAVFDVEKSEAYLNPTNFGILPDGKFLFNFAPKTIKKLNLKEEAYVSLANENDAMKLMPILGGSVGCLMGLEEIMAKSVSPSVKIKVKKIVISEMLRGMKGITQALIDEIYQKAQSFEGGFLSDSDLQRFIEREYDAFRKSLENTSGKSLGASDTVSLDAVMMVMDACGGIAGFYLKDEAPAIYHSLISRFASTEKLAAPSLVITGPVSAQALLLQIKEHKTVIAYYENEAFKKEFQRQAEAMKVKGEILQEELNRYGYFAYLPKLNLTRAEFVRQVLKNVKLDYDGVGRRSLGRIASESRIRNFMSRVVWEGDETLIRDVIEKLPVIVGRPLKVGSPGPQDHTERDIVVLKLASLLSENPEALEKKGFLTLENGIYVPTDLFFDFLAKAIQDHNFEKLTASMA